jgi:hypothetical protein
VLDEALTPLREHLLTLPGVTPLPCDGEGHAVEGMAACMHLRIAVPSPAREELLGRVAPVARQAQFVLTALVGRRDLYSLAYRPGKRGGDIAQDAARLVQMLKGSDPFYGGKGV